MLVMKNQFEMNVNISEILLNEKINEKILLIQNEINIYGQSKIISITSCENSYGACYFSCLLGQKYSLKSEKTIILDCNLYHPILSQFFDYEENCVLNNIMEENIDFSKMIKTENDSLSVVFSKKNDFPTEIFKSSNFCQFIDYLKNIYDHIIIITPSLVEHKDLILFKNYLSASFLVSVKELTLRKNVFEAVKFLENNHFPFIGTILIDYRKQKIKKK